MARWPRHLGGPLRPLVGLISLITVTVSLFALSGARSSHLPTLAAVVLLSTVIGGSVALLLAHRANRPILAVAQAATRVSAGDRSVRVDRVGVTGQAADLIDNFNKMAADIDASDRQRTMLAVGVAHELGTPLTILKGRLHGLEDGVIAPSSGEASRLLRQVEHLLRIVGDLNTLAHADAGNLTLDRRLIDLGDLLGPVVADLRAVLKARDVRFKETYAPALVHGDPVRLVQIFTNILTNAIKHAPQDCEVSVVVNVTGPWVVARILDEGPGFAPGDEALLFTPFWRATANQTAGRPGSGIGLSLAAKLAEAHEGHIRAENRHDRLGASFSVWLPLAQPSQDRLMTRRSPAVGRSKGAAAR
jgi:signal transduction histidine kinase